MSRKKINIYIIIGILACFLVCLFGSYHLAKEYVAKDFENTIDNLIVDFEKTYGMEDNTGVGDSYFVTTPEALMGEFSKEADHKYPWQAVFTTDNREIVTRSGSWMYFIMEVSMKILILMNILPSSIGKSWMIFGTK